AGKRIERLAGARIDSVGNSPRSGRRRVAPGERSEPGEHGGSQEKGNRGAGGGASVAARFRHPPRGFPTGGAHCRVPRVALHPLRGLRFTRGYPPPPAARAITTRFRAHTPAGRWLLQGISLQLFPRKGNFILWNRSRTYWRELP